MLQFVLAKLNTLFCFYTYLIFAIEQIFTLISVIGGKFWKKTIEIITLNMKVTYLSTIMSTLLVANEHASG